MIEAYIICWNEADTIHLTIKHYEQFCDKLTFYDNFSDDGTREIIQEYGHELRTFGKHGKLEDKEYVKIKNNCWKNSPADWVIIVDCDEIIWADNIKEIFTEETSKGHTIFNTFGFDIYSKWMPIESFLEFQYGVPSENYSKLAVFSPKIHSINYVYGCHVAMPLGNIHYCDKILNLFHYRNIGGVDRLIKRHEIYRKRLSEENIRMKLGVHYLQSDEERRKHWLEGYNKAIQFDLDRMV